MTNPYQIIVLDWEGTISDTLGLMFNTISLEAEKLGFGSLDPYKAREYANLGLVQAIKKAFPDLTLAQHEKLLHAIQQAPMTKPSEVWLIPGVREFIATLSQANIDLAIATNKGAQSLQRALQLTGLQHCFNVTRSAGQTPPKPCPQMLAEIIEQFHGHPSSTLMIGDSPSDMQMASALNVAGIGVDFYRQNTDALLAAGALAVFDDYQKLANFLHLNEGE